MIKDILEALEFDFRGEYIDIAKGKYKMPETIKESVKQFKEEIWQKKQRQMQQLKLTKQ